MNVVTNSMERLTKMLLSTDQKLKKMGIEPYGVRKATMKEQRDRYERLTPDELMNMIERYGADSVNKWLGKFMKEDNYGRL